MPEDVLTPPPASQGAPLPPLGGSAVADERGFFGIRVLEYINFIIIIFLLIIIKTTVTLVSLMKPLEHHQREFIARFVADLAKAIFAVGLASYFFSAFPAWVRLVIGLCFPFFFAVSLVLLPGRGDR